MESAKKKAKAQVEVKPTSIKNAPLSHGVGRRKSAVARVWLRRGNGKIAVNGVDYVEYFDTEVDRFEVVKPFKVLHESAKFDIEANVNGGGLGGQADAIKLGISRALLTYDERYRPVLREHDLLTVDSRVKERKKYGQLGARRKFQFVKR